MELISLSIKHYRNIEKKEVDFNNGVSLIVGKNGTGKTATIESILWALFGSKKEVVRDDRNSIVQDGKKKAEVILNFIVGGTNYTIKRTQTAGGTVKVELKDNDSNKIISRGIDETLTTIEEIINMPYDAFISSLYSPQGMLDNFTGLTPAKRREIITKILNIEKSEKLAGKSKLIRREIKKQAEGIKPYYDEFINIKDTALDGIKEIEESNEKLQERIDIRKGDINTIETVITNLKERRDEINISRQEHEKLLSESTKKKTLLEVAEKRLNTAKTDCDNINSELNKYPEERLDYSKEALKEIEDKIEELYNEKQDLKAEIHGLEEKLSDLEDLDSPICPTCYQEIDAELAEQEIVKVKGEITEKKEKFDSITWDDLFNQKQIYNKVGDLLHNKKLYDEVFDEKKRIVDALQEEVDNLPPGTKFDDTEYNSVIKQIDENDKITAIQSEISTLRGDISSNTIIINNKRNNYNNLKSKYEEYISLNTDLSRHNMFIEFMDNFRAYVITNIIPTVFDKASIILKILSNGELEGIKIDEKYNITVFSNGGEFIITRFSGGQKTLINISIRIALCVLFGKNDLLIMDEIFGALDEDALDRSVESILNLPFKQIIIISHLHGIKDKFRNVIM